MKSKMFLVLIVMLAMIPTFQVLGTSTTIYTQDGYADPLKRDYMGYVEAGVLYDHHLAIPILKPGSFITTGIIFSTTGEGIGRGSVISNATLNVYVPYSKTATNDTLTITVTGYDVSLGLVGGLRNNSTSCWLCENTAYSPFVQFPPRTTALTDIDISGWDSPGWYTIDVTEIVQELVRSFGYNEDNNIGLVIYGASDPNTEERWLWSNVGENMPYIDLEFTPYIHYIPGSNPQECVVYNGWLFCPPSDFGENFTTWNEVDPLGLLNVAVNNSHRVEFADFGMDYFWDDHHEYTKDLDGENITEITITGVQHSTSWALTPYRPDYRIFKIDCDEPTDTMNQDNGDYHDMTGESYASYTSDQRVMYPGGTMANFGDWREGENMKFNLTWRASSPGVNRYYNFTVWSPHGKYQLNDSANERFMNYTYVILNDITVLDSRGGSSFYTGYNNGYLTNVTIEYAGLNTSYSSSDGGEWTATKDNETLTGTFEDLINLIGASDPDPDDPAPPGWTDTGWFTRPKMRGYMLFMGLGFVFVPMYLFSVIKTGQEKIMFFWVMLFCWMIGFSLLLSITNI